MPQEPSSGAGAAPFDPPTWRSADERAPELYTGESLLSVRRRAKLHAATRTNPSRVVLFAPGHVYLSNKRLIFIPSDPDYTAMNFPLKEIEDETVVKIVFGVKAIRFNFNRPPVPLVVKVIMHEKKWPFYLLLLSFLAQVRFGRGARAFAATGERERAASFSSESAASSGALSSRGNPSSPSLRTASASSTASSPRSAASELEPASPPLSAHPAPRSRPALFAIFSRAAPDPARPAEGDGRRGPPCEAAKAGACPEGRRVAFVDPATGRIHLAEEVAPHWGPERAEEEREAAEPWQRTSRVYTREDFDRMCAEIEAVVRRKEPSAGRLFARRGRGRGPRAPPPLDAFLSLRMEALRDLPGADVVPPPIATPAPAPAPRTPSPRPLPPAAAPPRARGPLRAPQSPPPVPRPPAPILLQRPGGVLSVLLAP